ncbi:MAG: hypothetical protein WDW36_009768 [Sanguina aurantia]
MQQPERKLANKRVPRVLAWHCFGKLALLPGLGTDLASLCLVPKALEVLRSVENPRVQEAAAAALLDAGQVFGTPCLDGLAILGQELQHMPVADQLCHALVFLLQQPAGALLPSETSYMRTLAQGLCRLTLSQSTHVRLQAVLSSGATTSQRYMSLGGLGAQHVCVALVPALEVLMSVDTTNGRCKGLAVQLIHLIVKLLPGEANRGVNPAVWGEGDVH